METPKMADQDTNFHHGLWKDIQLYLADAPTSHDNFSRIMTSLLVICVFCTVPIAFAPARVQRVRPPSGLSRLKLYIVSFLMIIETFVLVSWFLLPSFRTLFTPSAAAINFIFACSTGFVVDTTAKRPGSWIPALSFLLLGVLSTSSDCAKHCKANSIVSFGCSIMLASISCRLFLLLIIVAPGCFFEHKGAGEVSLYDSWYSELVAILDPVLLSIFKDFSSIDSLKPLGPEFDPSRLSQAFSKHWSRLCEKSSNRLLTVCLRMVSWWLFVGIIPRLITTLFLLAQPLLLKRIVVYVGLQISGPETKWTLVLSVCILFLGSSVSKASYNFFGDRMHTALRGALLLQVFEKVDRLGQNGAKSSTLSVLISADISTICVHTQSLYHVLHDVIHVGLGLVSLWMLAGPACLFGIGVIAVSIAINVALQPRITKMQRELAEVARKRTENMRNAVSQLTLIKMLGLRSAVLGRIYALRLAEIDCIKAAFANDTYRQIADMLVDTATGSFLSLGFYLLSPTHVTPEFVFPTLALSVQLTIALYTGFRKCTFRGHFSASLERVERFLLQEEFPDPRTVASLGNIAVKCAGLSLAPEGSKEPCLRNINFSVVKGSFTACIGPSSSGKSTFLQALVGAAQVVDGSLAIDNAQVAYCDQDPWMENMSIRESVVAGLEFESERYDVVIRLCLLHRDIENLDEGDAYLTGVNGVNLSSGQRHRIALARALYFRQAMVVLDDLFSSLDPRSATSILYLLCGKENGFLRRENRTVFLSTYLVDCFDIADQILIFDGLGNAILRSIEDVDLEFKDMLEKLNSPHERNPEEEDHKQLAGILRSRKIRADFSRPAQQLAITGKDPAFGLLAFYGEASEKFSAIPLLVVNFLLALGENLTEYRTYIWLDLYPKNINYPLTFVATSLSFVVACLIRTRFVTRVMIPSNVRHLDEFVIQKVFRSTLAYLGAVDPAYLLQQVDSQFELATHLASRINALFYNKVIFHAIIRSFSIVSGVKAGILLLPGLGVFAWAMIYFSRRASRQIQTFSCRADELLNQRLISAADGIRHTRAFGKTQQALDETLEIIGRSQKLCYAELCRKSCILFLCDLNTTVSLTILILLGINNPTLCSQSGIGFSFWSSSCFSHALECLVRNFASGEKFSIDAHHLQETITKIPSEDHLSGVNVPASWPERGEVLFENVTARYNIRHTSNPALHQVSLMIEPGEKLAISGRTGSGKSSLLLALLGFLHYDGTIKIDGIDISTINRDVLRSRVITLTYEPLQLPTTVRKNLLPFDFQYSATGEASLDDATLTDVLSDLGVWGPISRQGGLDAYLPAVKLSRSEMQLFGIARAILQRMGREGKLILMDEATSALDKATDKRVQGALTAAFPGCTFMIITHRQMTVGDAEKFLELEEGSVTSFRDIRQMQEEDEDEARISYNQLAESAGGGTVEYNPPE